MDEISISAIDCNFNWCAHRKCVSTTHMKYEYTLNTLSYIHCTLQAITCYNFLLCQHVPNRVPNRRHHRRININAKKSLSVFTTTTPPPPSTTVNPIYEYSEEMNAAAESDFNARRHLLWATCAKYQNISSLTPNAWEFFISPGHGIAWCNVFKAASSAWMYYFNILGK